MKGDERGGEAGGSATMRLKAYVPLRRLNVSRDEGVDGVHIHIHTETRAYTQMSVCTRRITRARIHERR